MKKIATGEEAINLSFRNGFMKTITKNKKGNITSMKFVGLPRNETYIKIK